MAKASGPKRALLDSCAWISVIKGEPTAGLIRPLLRLAQSDKVTLVGSTLLLAEVYQPSPDPVIDRRRQQILAQIESPEMHLVDVSPRVARRAAELRRDYRFKTPDAIHLATAELARVEWFVTMDVEFAKKRPAISGLSIYVVDASTSARDLPWCGPEQPALFSVPD